MKERPIIFGGAMVQAILADKKTQTRRVIKLNGTEEVIDGMLWRPDRYGDWYPIEDYCPYHNCTRLWVREAWGALWPDLDPVPLRDCKIEYRADSPNAPYPGDWPSEEARGNDEAPKWKPSIFMPRWSSRITLEIVSVRAERLQDISEEDVRAEGCETGNEYWYSEFRTLWDSINASRGYSWESNPWVWVISFRKLEAAK